MVPKKTFHNLQNNAQLSYKENLGTKYRHHLNKKKINNDYLLQTKIYLNIDPKFFLLQGFVTPCKFDLKHIHIGTKYKNNNFPQNYIYTHEKCFIKS